MIVEKINLNPIAPRLSAPAQDVARLAEIYLENLQGRIALKTIQNIKSRLKYLLRFWTEHGEDYKWHISPDALEQFARWLDSYKSANGGLLEFSTKQAALKQARIMLRWSWRNQYLPSDWSKFVPAPQGKPREHAALELADLRLIFDQAMCAPRHLEMACLVALMAGTGCRRNECSNIRVADVHFVDGASGHIDITAAKGGGSRQVAFDSISGRWLKLHIEQNCGARTWLFESRIHGEKMSGKSINTHLSDFANKAGVTWDGAHSLRRSFATHWLRKLPGEGFGVLLAKQMGHSVPSLTLGLYNRLRIEDVRKAMDRHKCSFFAQAMA